MKKFDVITIGTATHDVYLHSTSFRTKRDKEFSTGKAECFALGAKLEVEQLSSSTGGGATNAAASFAAQGLKTAVLTKVGAHDVYAEDIMRDLTSRHVDVSLAKRDQKTATGFSVILLTPEGERTILVYRGASARITPRDINFRLFSTRWIYLSSIGGNKKDLDYIFKKAAEKKIRISWNPGKMELSHGSAGLKKYLSQCEILSLNFTEAQYLSKKDSIKEMVKKLRTLTQATILITHNCYGAYIAQGNDIYHIKPRPVRVADSTGAGDAFTSGFVGSIIRQKGLAQSARFAEFNAESVIGHIGAKNGIVSVKAKVPKFIFKKI